MVRSSVYKPHTESGYRGDYCTPYEEGEHYWFAIIAMPTTKAAIEATIITAATTIATTNANKKTIRAKYEIIFVNSFLAYIAGCCLHRASAGLYLFLNRFIF